MIRDDQPDAREGQAGRTGVAERPVVPLKPGNAGEGRGLSSRPTQDVVKDLEIGHFKLPCFGGLQGTTSLTGVTVFSLVYEVFRVI